MRDARFEVVAAAAHAAWLRTDMLPERRNRGLGSRRHGCGRRHEGRKRLLGGTAERKRMIDIEKAAEKLVEYLDKHGSADERNISMDRTDHYKPLYRTIALFIAPTHTYQEDMLEGRPPTQEEAAEIMRRADPYFIKALEEDWETFDSLWESHMDAWDWEDENRTEEVQQFTDMIREVKGLPPRTVRGKTDERS
jgi:hypothetical protein